MNTEPELEVCVVCKRPTDGFCYREDCSAHAQHRPPGTEPKPRGKRIWVWPIKARITEDFFQEQRIVTIWLRWPTYRPPAGATRK